MDVWEDVSIFLTDVIKDLEEHLPRKTGREGTTREFHGNPALRLLTCVPAGATSHPREGEQGWRQCWC